MCINWNQFYWYCPNFDARHDFPDYNCLVGCVCDTTGEVWYSYVVLPQGQGYFR